MRIDLLSRLQGPSALHWLGTDEFGRDVFSRLLIGARTSLWISLLTVTVAVLAGTLIGMLAGYLRGWTDRLLMMFNDALLAFPGILMALGIMAIIGASKYGIVLALGIAYTPSVVRVVRGTVLSLRELEYIEASRVIGNWSCTPCCGISRRTVLRRSVCWPPACSAGPCSRKVP